MYNRTPLRHLNWQTPYKLLYRERPSIDHLRVFGCGAYIFIPAETRVNKLAPKSEVMTYLGNAPGANGFVFMRGPNNILYYTMHCIFDESMCPKCPKQAKTPSTRLHGRAPPLHYHADDPLVEEETPSKRVPRTKPSGVEGEPKVHQPTAKGKSSPALPFVKDELSPQEPSSHQSRDPSPPRHAVTPQPMTRRSKREKKVPRREGNVYGETRHPTDIVRNFLFLTCPTRTRTSHLPQTTPQTTTGHINHTQGNHRLPHHPDHHTPFPNHQSLRPTNPPSLRHQRTQPPIPKRIHPYPTGTHDPWYGDLGHLGHTGPRPWCKLSRAQEPRERLGEEWP